MKERVKKFFSSNKGVDVIYSSSDGFLFIQKRDATAHSRTLKNKNVAKHSRGVEKSEDMIPDESGMETDSNKEKNVKQ